MTNFLFDKIKQNLRDMLMIFFSELIDLTLFYFK